MEVSSCVIIKPPHDANPLPVPTERVQLSPKLRDVFTTLVQGLIDIPDLTGVCVAFFFQLKRKVKKIEKKMSKEKSRKISLLLKFFIFKVKKIKYKKSKFFLKSKLYLLLKFFTYSTLPPN